MLNYKIPSFSTVGFPQKFLSHHLESKCVILKEFLLKSITFLFEHQTQGMVALLRFSVIWFIFILLDVELARITIGK